MTPIDSAKTGEIAMLSKFNCQIYYSGCWYIRVRSEMLTTLLLKT